MNKIRILKANTERARLACFDSVDFVIRKARVNDYIDELRQQARWDNEKSS